MQKKAPKNSLSASTANAQPCPQRPPGAYREAQPLMEPSYWLHGGLISQAEVHLAAFDHSAGRCWSPRLL